MKQFFCLIGFITIFYFPANSQDVTYLLNEGAQLEKEMKDPEALKKYQEALQLAPADLKALFKCSELNSAIGKRQQDKKMKMEYFNAAKTYAETALTINKNDADANFAMALALASMSTVSGTKDKMDLIKDIKKYADSALATDPEHYKALHLSGRWTMEVASLNIAEKTALKIVFGGLPSASMPAAIDLFERSRKKNPNFILNYLDLAKAYKANGQSDKAIEVLNRMIKLPPKTLDDDGYKSEGKKLLESLL